jgi:hypothetical protein
MGEREDQIRFAVEYLCSEECAGRRTGSPEGERARRWIASQFEALGLSAFSDDFVQTVPAVHGGNVLGFIPGESEGTILVAAHFDHLGKASGGDAYWGADDNAAGVGILLDVARRLRGRRLPKRVLFAAFDAEEPPHFLSANMGSQHFVRNPPIPISSIDMMICMDLMGHALGDEDLPDGVRRSVFALGAEKTTGAGGIVDAVSAAAGGVRVRRMGSDVIPPLSDYYAFAEERVPYLFLTAGRWKHYHTVTDTPEKLDYRKMIASADFLSSLVVELSHRERGLFDPGARDDRKSLRTLREMGELLRTHVPAVSAVEPILESLEKEVDRHGALRSTEQQTLASLVGTLESFLE